MTREELIKWLDDEIIHSAELCEDGDAKSWGYEEGILISRNEAEEIREFLALPPAEGAEEILEKYMQGNQSISMEGKKSRRVAFGSAIRAMREFATLHAQRLAEKMVEEKLIEFGNMIRDEPNGDIPALAEYFMRTINLKSKEQ